VINSLTLARACMWRRRIFRRKKIKETIVAYCKSSEKTHRTGHQGTRRPRRTAGAALPSTASVAPRTGCTAGLLYSRNLSSSFASLSWPAAAAFTVSLKLALGSNLVQAIELSIYLLRARLWWDEHLVIFKYLFAAYRAQIYALYMADEMWRRRWKKKADVSDLVQSKLLT
jgi:hypothetical protein